MISSKVYLRDYRKKSTIEKDNYCLRLTYNGYTLYIHCYVNISIIYIYINRIDVECENFVARYLSAHAYISLIIGYKM